MGENCFEGFCSSKLDVHLEEFCSYIEDSNNSNRSMEGRSQTSPNAEIALAANFPAAVAAAMMRGETVKAVSKPAVSILFLHVDGYGKMRGEGLPTTVCSMLARLFGALDALAAAHGVERIDAVDGCYIAAANFSARQPADHAVRLGRFALAALAAAASISVDAERPELGAVRLLAGMHCGAVCGSVVGAHGGRKHTLHGDAVNVASRMQSHGAAGAVQCSAGAAALIEAQGGVSGGGLRLARREGDVEMKGLGRMAAFWLATCAPTCRGQSEHSGECSCPSGPEARRHSAGMESASQI